ncbi:MAG TPA: hypothetical protein VGN16_10995 [Acidobacteriaceae bacterium]|jgi:hypothetical protein
MTDAEALVQEREIVNDLTEGMESLICRLVALRVLLEDLRPSREVNQIEKLLVDRFSLEVRAELHAQFAIIRDHPHVTTPRIDWNQIVESLVEKGKGFDLSPSDEDKNRD